MAGAAVTGPLHAIDCDVHPTVPDMKALLPYLDDFWRETGGGARHQLARDRQPIRPMRRSPRAPEWRGKDGRAGDRGVGAHRAGLRPLAGRHRDLQLPLRRAACCSARTWRAAFARALNDWIAKEWLDRDPRLRASIVVPMQNVEFAVDEIERCAKDRRFVQVLVLAMQETPLGRRHLWPIYAAAERHGLPLGIHAGSSYRHSSHVARLADLLHRGLCQPQRRRFSRRSRAWSARACSPSIPASRWCCWNPGVTWLPGFLWRFSKFWRGVRAEVPWVDRSPAEIVRDHVRLTIQPFDAPDDPDAGGTGHRSSAFRRHAALRVGLSALAVRRRRDRPGGHAGRAASQDPGGQSARDL